MLNKIKKDNKQITIRFNLNMIVVGLLTILVFVSVVQTATLAKLIGNKSTISTSNSGQTKGKSNLPAALESVPQQQGGC